jgi:hypothetical protein
MENKTQIPNSGLLNPECPGSHPGIPLTWPSLSFCPHTSSTLVFVSLCNIPKFSHCQGLTSAMRTAYKALPCISTCAAPSCHWRVHFPTTYILEPHFVILLTSIGIAWLNFSLFFYGS